MSLGIKQCQANPWESFGTKYQKDDKVSGKIKSITDFGIFIGLEGGIDGLVHLSDISWEEPGEEAVRKFAKGDELETVILSIDPERERISLGVKQLTGDPFGQYVAENDRNAIVKGKVIAVDQKVATIALADGIEGTLKASEMSRDRVEDLSAVLKVGDEVEAKITAVDRKNRAITLSVKAKDMKDEAEAVENLRQDAQAPKTIGDLIKAQMGGNE